MKIDFQQIWNIIGVLVLLERMHLQSKISKKELLMGDKDKDLVAVVDLILDAIGVVVDAEKDSKIDLADLPLLMKLVPDLGPAFSNLAAVPGELAALSAEDAAALVAHVMAKLTITDEKARRVIEAALKAATAAYGLVLAIKS